MGVTGAPPMQSPSGHHSYMGLGEERCGPSGKQPLTQARWGQNWSQGCASRACDLPIGGDSLPSSLGTPRPHLPENRTNLWAPVLISACPPQTHAGPSEQPTGLRVPWGHETVRVLTVECLTGAEAAN